jgi:hypothetical protein
MVTKYPDAPSGDSFEQGMIFQDFVADVLFSYGIAITAYSSRKYQYQYGENKQGIEIKLDTLWQTTGRLSIETGERTSVNKSWVASGIYRDDNSWLYVQGNESGFFVFSRKLLQQLHRTNRYKNKEEPTVRAFYLPEQDAERYAAIVWRSEP